MRLNTPGLRRLQPCGRRALRARRKNDVELLEHGIQGIARLSGLGECSKEAAAVNAPPIGQYGREG